MPKNSYRRVDSNIYVEQRSGTHRFQIAVYPFKKVSRTFDTFAEGVAWSLAERERLLKRKADGGRPARKPSPNISGQSADPSSQSRACPLRDDDPQPPSPQRGTPIAVDESSSPSPLADPASVRLDAILTDYDEKVAGSLADPSEARARLRKLKQWFGQLTLKDLTRDTLETWIDRRLSGALGAGRGNGRDLSGGPVLTKDQRRRARQAGRQLAPLTQSGPAPVSPQTVRHELGYLRRAVKTYFDHDGRSDAHALWLASQPVMRIDLPEQAAPRERRISDEELGSILAKMSSRVNCFAVMFAIATGLRRAEVVSLRWEDLDTAKRVVRLKPPPGAKGSVRGPGRIRGRRSGPRTKTHERSVPLTPLALKVLTTYGVEASGRIFPRAPGSLSQAWRRAADRVGLVDARLHDCRREAVSRLVDEYDLTVEKLALFTGHRDIAVLQRHYLRPSAERLAESLAERGPLQSAFGLVDAGLGLGGAG